MGDALFPLIFHDGKQGYHKGIISVNPATTFELFLQQVSLRIPGLDPQHFHVEIVCSRAGAPADARQKIPIHANTNFHVVLNQHNPAADPNAHFMVMLKRPEQRQLDQQRKLMGQQPQQPQQGSLKRAEPLLQPKQRGQRTPLKGAAYPWTGNPGMPGVNITAQMKRAWSASPEPSPQVIPNQKRQANMWGAVPQHHQGIAPAQAQQLNAIAQAAANAQAHAHARLQGGGVGGPGVRPQGGPGPGPNQPFGLQNGPAVPQARQVLVPPALRAAQHVQHGFVLPPPPPPAINAALPIQGEQWTRGMPAAIRLQQDRMPRPRFPGAQTFDAQVPLPRPFGPVGHPPQGISTQRLGGMGPQPTISPQPSGTLQQQALGLQGITAQLQAIGVQPQGIAKQPHPGPESGPQQGVDLPFRPTRILTRANAGQLGYHQGQGQLGLQPGQLQQSFSSGPDAGWPVCQGGLVGDQAAPGPMHGITSHGETGFGNSFWSNSPRDHVMPRDHVVQSFLVKKLNPFGSISSPRETKIASGWNGPSMERSDGDHM